MYQSNMDGATPPETTPSSAGTPSATATTPVSASPPANGTPQGFALPAVELMPLDFSHVGQAFLLKGYYGDQLRYAEAAGWLVYNGSYYEQGAETRARGIAQALTSHQLVEAEDAVKQCSIMAKMQGLDAKQKSDLKHTTTLMDAYRSHVSR